MPSTQHGPGEVLDKTRLPPGSSWSTRWQTSPKESTSVVCAPSSCSKIVSLLLVAAQSDLAASVASPTQNLNWCILKVLRLSFCLNSLQRPPTWPAVSCCLGISPVTSQTTAERCRRRVISLRGQNTSEVTATLSFRPSFFFIPSINICPRLR